MLKIINYSKAYRKDQYAVKNLNLEVEAGDLFAFIGHNDKINSWYFAI